MTETRYGFQVKLPVPYDQAVEKTTAALKQEGFGVLTSIDVKQTLKAKLDADFRKYVILGACNPPLAHRAITADPDIGLLLPCNVVVREETDKGITVGFMDPIAVMKLTDNPGITDIAKDVRARLERVRDQLKG